MYDMSFETLISLYAPIYGAAGIKRGQKQKTKKKRRQKTEDNIKMAKKKENRRRQFVGKR